ncbi:hypothetical protein ORN01_25385 [Bacillus cereus]|nr:MULTISPECIES: hypothetical protein [Bacillus cereus group]MDA1509589.1 hypothetical protein [Bacillus cereus group sp. TH36-2LC]MDZ4632293.1 hypothetical protein [Bacillus cereus]
MSREEKIKFLVEAIYEVEGAVVHPEHFADRSDEQIEEDVEWYDYLLTK